MSYLTHFDFSNLGAGRKGEPLPGRLVEGDPQFTTWDIAKSADGRVTAGVWEVTPARTGRSKARAGNSARSSPAFQNWWKRGNRSNAFRQATISSCNPALKASGA